MVIKNPTDSFESFDEFIDCIRRGCEIEFVYDGQRYAVWHGNCICIGKIIDESSFDEVCYEYDNAENAGTYMLNGKMLKDIVADLQILDRLF